jgi:hypothetical protein
MTSKQLYEITRSRRPSKVGSQRVKKTFKRVPVQEWSADCLSGMFANSPPTRLFSRPSVRNSTKNRAIKKSAVSSDERVVKKQSGSRD